LSVRKLNDKGTSLCLCSFSCIHADDPIVAVYDLPRQIKPDAGPFFFLYLWPISPVKPLKHFVVFFSLDSDPFILDFDSEKRQPFFCSQKNMAPLWAVLYRIIQNIDQRFPKPLSVMRNLERLDFRIRIHLNLDLFFI